MGKKRQAGSVKELSDLYIAIGIMAIATIIIMNVAFFVVDFYTSRSEIILIQDIEVKIVSNGDVARCICIVFADKRIFRYIDNLYWNNISDTFSCKLLELRGKRVKIYYRGLRVPYFYPYLNIYKIETI